MTRTGPTISITRLLISDRYWRYLVVFMIFGVTLFCYSPNLHNFFVAEDLFQVWNTQLSYLLRQFFPNQVAGYRPFMFIWWWACYNLFGYHPLAFRWVVLLLHAVNGALLYAITLVLSRSRFAGLLAAALYLPLTVHSDALNWLSAASNQVTCGFFYFLSIWLYLRYRQASDCAQHSRIGWLRIGTIVSMLGALGTNEIALTLPFVMLSLDFAMLPFRKLIKRPKRRNVVIGSKRIAPFFAAWLLFMIVRTLAVHGIGGYGADVHLRASEYLFQTGQALVSMVLTPFSTDAGLSWVINAVSASHILLLCTLIVLCIALWSGRAGLCLFVLAALPILNIPAYHRLYIPMAGLAIAVALSLASTLKTLRKPWAGIAIAASVILIAGIFIRQFSAITERNQEWTKASTITAFVPERTHELVPATPPKTVFYYYGLPLNLGNGVQVFNWGLQQVVQATYNDRSLRAYRVQINATPTYNLERSPDQILQQSRSEMNQVFFVFNAQPLELQQYSRDEFIRIVESTARVP